MSADKDIDTATSSGECDFFCWVDVLKRFIISIVTGKSDILSVK